MANHILAFFYLCKKVFFTWDLSVFTMAFRDPLLMIDKYQQACFNIQNLILVLYSIKIGLQISFKMQMCDMEEKNPKMPIPKYAPKTFSL